MSDDVIAAAEKRAADAERRYEEAKANTGRLEGAAPDPQLEPEPQTMSDFVRAAAGRKPAAQTEGDDTVKLDGGARQSTTPPQAMNEWIRERAGR
jgi:hypothetical protein